MKKSTIVIIALIVVLVGSWVGAFLWVRSERVASLDRLNRMDYSATQSDKIPASLQEDIGLSLDEVRDKDPSSTGLRSFPELYLVARVLTITGDAESSAKYYKATEGYLENYHKKQEVAPDFYLAYIAAVSSDEEKKSIASRAEAVVNNLSVLSSGEKAYYVQMLQVYATGEAAPSEE